MFHVRDDVPLLSGSVGECGSLYNKFVHARTHIHAHTYTYSAFDHINPPTLSKSKSHNPLLTSCLLTIPHWVQSASSMRAWMCGASYWSTDIFLKKTGLQLSRLLWWARLLCKHPPFLAMLACWLSWFCTSLTQISTLLWVHGHSGSVAPRRHCSAGFSTVCSAHNLSNLSSAMFSEPCRDGVCKKMSHLCLSTPQLLILCTL